MLTASVNLPDDIPSLPVLGIRRPIFFFGQSMGMKWYLIVNLCKFFCLYDLAIFL